MKWEGKLIGGTIGLVTLGSLGAAVGLLLGHLFDAGQLSGVMFGARPDPRLVNELFFPTTFRVMGHIAKADGVVTEQEIASARAIMNNLHLQGPQIQAAIGYFTEGKQPAFDVDTALSRLRASIARFPDLAQFFIEIQLQASIAGGGFSAVPRARLQRVALLLGLSSRDFAQLENLLRFRQRTAAAGGSAGAGFGYGPSASYGAGAGYGARPGYAYGADGAGGAGGGMGAAAASNELIVQAYSLLEATPQMSDDEVVKAYRRQMSRHHPDKLKANGLPPSMLERAKERTQQIQSAYEVIRERRGMR